MALRRINMMLFIAISLVSLALPALASAQGPWSRDRDYRRDRDDDTYDNDRYRERYNRQALRNSVRRIKKLSEKFQDHVDSALDKSRYNGSRREDQINRLAEEFKDAAGDLESNIGDGRNLNRSADEAHRLLQLGSRIDRFMSYSRSDSRISHEWDQISRELNFISSVYGYNRTYEDDNYNNRRRRRF
jgi:hypothetical protein